MQPKRARITFLGVVFGLMIGLIIFKVQSITDFQIFYVVEKNVPSCKDAYECLVKDSDNYYIRDWISFVSFDIIDNKSRLIPNLTEEMLGWIEKLPFSYAKINSDGFRGRNYSITGKISLRNIIL